MKKTLLAAAAVASTLMWAATPTLAHHSFAMFDGAKTATFSGTVKDLQWTNPHVWLQLAVSENGTPRAYDFEAGAVAVLKRAGWTRDSVKAGDTITLTSHPFKNGKPGGSLESVKLAGGQTLTAGNGIPGAIVVGGQH